MRRGYPSDRLRGALRSYAAFLDETGTGSRGAPTGSPQPTAHTPPPRRRHAVIAVAAVVAVAIAVGVVAGRDRRPDRVRTDRPPAATRPASPTRVPRMIGVVGDSVAVTISWGLQRAVEGTTVRVESRAFPACGIAAGIATDDHGRPYSWSRACADEVPRQHAQLIAELRPDLIVWSSAWELSGQLDPSTKTVVKFGTPAGDRALRAEMATAARRLTAGGARLVLLTIPPRASDASPTRVDGSREAHYNALLRDFAAAHRDNTAIVDVVPFVCPDGRCPMTVKGVVLRPDGVHYTRRTAPVLARWLLPQLRVFGR